MKTRVKGHTRKIKVNNPRSRKMKGTSTKYVKVKGYTRKK